MKAIVTAIMIILATVPGLLVLFATVNSALAVAIALIAAGLHGIENELEPPPAVEGNAYESDVDRFPSTMVEAVAALESGTMARAAMGDQVVDRAAITASASAASSRRTRPVSICRSASRCSADRSTRSRRRPAPATRTGSTTTSIPRPNWAMPRR